MANILLQTREHLDIVHDQFYRLTNRDPRTQSDTRKKLEEMVNSLENKELVCGDSNQNENLKPVQCDFCDEKFVRNSDMEAPVEIHEKSK